MTTLDAIQKQQQKILRLERNSTLQEIKKRKQDTRRKIELGGLVIKAKMDKYPKAIVLGALIDAFEQLEQNEGTKTLFRSKGETEFLGYGESDNGKHSTTK